MLGGRVIGSLLLESSLHRVEQLSIQNWRLFTRKDFAFVPHLADVEAIAQEVEEGALREEHAAARAAVRQLADLCSQIALAKLES